MKLIIHLVTDDKLVIHSHDAMSAEEISGLQQAIQGWNTQKDKMGLFFTNSDIEIIDMRTPQKEQIEQIINQVLDKRAQWEIFKP